MDPAPPHRHRARAHGTVPRRQRDRRLRPRRRRTDARVEIRPAVRLEGIRPKPDVTSSRPLLSSARRAAAAPRRSRQRLRSSRRHRVRSRLFRTLNTCRRAPAARRRDDEERRAGRIRLGKPRHRQRALVVQLIVELGLHLPDIFLLRLAQSGPRVGRWPDWITNPLTTR